MQFIFNKFRITVWLRLLPNASARALKRNALLEAKGQTLILGRYFFSPEGEISLPVA